jgi:hypothetical protein
MNAIYINENGRTTCLRHGGMYLTAAVKANPNTNNYDTPLDNWERLTTETLQEFDLHCETCGGI